MAARGIDVNDLTHVFHYTLPDDNSYYTHRSGRTARAGKKGTSIAFVGKKERYRISRLERQLGISFEPVQIPDVEAIAEIRTRNWVMTVLETKSKGKVSPELIEEATLLFGLLSKEELIAKLLTKEIESLNLGSTKDLNDNSPDEDSDRDRGRGRGRGRGRDRGGRDRRGGSKGRGRHKGGKRKDKKKDTKERFESGRFKKKDKSKDEKGGKKKKDRGPKKPRFRDKTKPKK